MRPAIPTELLLRLIHATPEQYAAIAKILGVEGGSVGTSSLSDSTLNRESKRAEAASEIGNPTVSEDVARSAFALLQKLELDAPLKAPSVLTVFRLYCVDGHSADRVARKCRCGKATVIRRLQLIEARTGVKAELFRAMSSHLQQIDNEMNSSSAREIYRRGLANENDVD